MSQRYGATVSIAITGNTITGWRGFSNYLERFMEGIFILKLDASLAPSEFAINAQVINPQVGSESKWSISAWKVVNPPPPRPPGTYIAVITLMDGVRADIDFDVTATTFN